MFERRAIFPPLPAAWSVAVAIAVPQMAAAENLCMPEVAQLVSAQGQVEAQRARTQVWLSASQSQVYCGSDKVRTGTLSRAVLFMQQGIATYLALDQQTLVDFLQDAGKVLLSVQHGQAHIRSHTPRHFDVKTPFVNAGIEGTEFLVKSGTDSAEVTVFEGRVKVSNDQGELTITGGQTAFAQAGSAPVLKQLTIKPDDAVQWALYYPPLIDPAGFDRTANDNLSAALHAYRRGDIQSALDIMAKQPIDRGDSEQLAVYAGLLLTVGRADAAERLLAQAAQPEHGLLQAVASIIALAHNDKQHALDRAEQATVAAPDSPVPYIARSYAQQAHFRLADALQSVEQALEKSPDNALAYCRKAELLAALGQSSEARQAAERAATLNPNLGRSDTVLGFTQLMGTDVEGAAASFNTAIRKDASDPLAHFGLALTQIRRGDLARGVDTLEFAASLNPHDSLIRSYLGKAYYEQKRGTIADLQFQLAKQADPNDPTPYFYSAVQKHAENRPVEALVDMEKAVELNDNRAVYRSKQMLESDLAARGSAVGRIYNELGFGPRAMVQAWQALADDPTDYSAHRLLSDAYGALPRSDLARTSELLQSQLLQPINTTPIQPRLAESSQFLVGNMGPSALSLNEFNPMFERNRATTLVSGQVGTQNTYSDEVVHAGLWNDWSYSLGQFHYQTDGYRVNNGVDVNIYNAFVQGRLTPELSVLGEYRFKDLSYGNLSSKFFPRTYISQLAVDNQTNRTEKNNYKVGFNWSPTKQQKILGVFSYFDQSDSIAFKPYAFKKGNKVFHSDFFQENYSYSGNNNEIQYFIDAPIFKTIVGGGAGQVDRVFSGYTEKESQYNGYVYSYLSFPHKFLWTTGVGITAIDNEFEVKRSINPKIGLLWSITADTVLRIAGFKTVKHSWFTGESLEPTQIAGFSQNYADRYMMPATRYGIGLDKKVSSTLNAGVEISKRRLKRMPSESWDEIVYRGYLSWSPHPLWVVGLDFLSENFSNNNLYISGTPRNTKTILVPAKIAYFDPSGWFASLKSTYYNQQVEENIIYVEDNANFVDLGFGFRLPERHGLFELQLQNIFNQSYRYEDYLNRASDERSNGLPSNIPFPFECTVFARLTLSF